jgi:hypothetical protein
MRHFELWLEFEAVDPGNWDMENDFVNINFDLPDGRYGINVWTFKFFETAIAEEKLKGNDLYLRPPDLFVKVLTRDCIEKTISDLLNIGNLEDVLNRTVLSCSNP